MNRRKFLELVVAGIALISKEHSSPTVYYTENKGLNPPKLDNWAVAKGFPTVKIGARMSPEMTKWLKMGV